MDLASGSHLVPAVLLARAASASAQALFTARLDKPAAGSFPNTGAEVVNISADGGTALFFSEATNLDAAASLPTSSFFGLIL